MWSSREMMKDDSDKQLYVKTTLRELIIYFIFLVTVLISEMLKLIILERISSQGDSSGLKQGWDDEDLGSALSQINFNKSHLPF